MAHGTGGLCVADWLGRWYDLCSLLNGDCSANNDRKRPDAHKWGQIFVCCFANSGYCRYSDARFNAIIGHSAGSSQSRWVNQQRTKFYRSAKPWCLWRRAFAWSAGLGVSLNHYRNLCSDHNGRYISDAPHLSVHSLCQTSRNVYCPCPVNRGWHRTFDENDRTITCFGNLSGRCGSGKQRISS